MKIILLDKIIRLGDIGDVVNVKSGFARNYLIPQKKAMFANEENIKIVEAKKAELAAESEDLKVQAQAAADAGLWDVAFPLTGLSAPPKDLELRPDFTMNLGEDEGVAKLADPRHVTAVLQWIGDAASLRRKREEARKRRGGNWGEDEEKNPKPTGKGGGKQAFWKAWKEKQAQERAEAAKNK